MTEAQHLANKTQTMHEVLRNVPYNAFIVGVGATPQEENAFVCSWAMQCSFEPPMFTVAIRKDTMSHNLLMENKVFAISMLDESHENLARRLVKPRSQVGDKLGQVSHYEEVTGAPILREAMAFVECRSVDHLNAGDHTLFVGEVVNAGQKKEAAPLTLASLDWKYGG